MLPCFSFLYLHISFCFSLQDIERYQRSPGPVYETGTGTKIEDGYLTIQGNGNYTGKITKKYYIAPQKAKIKSVTTVGQGKHLKLKVDCDGKLIDCIGFKMGELFEELTSDDWNEIIEFIGQYGMEIDTKEVLLDNLLDYYILIQKYYY